MHGNVTWSFKLVGNDASDKMGLSAPKNSHQFKKRFLSVKLHNRGLA